jgi:hypothetical protein
MLRIFAQCKLESFSWGIDGSFSLETVQFIINALVHCAAVRSCRTESLPSYADNT